MLKERPTCYTKEELRKMLPKVGTRLMKPMMRSFLETSPLEPCTVVEVNTYYYWYRVRFDKTGTCQCFKLPEN